MRLLSYRGSLWVSLRVEEGDGNHELSDGTAGTESSDLDPGALLCSDTNGDDQDGHGSLEITFSHSTVLY